MKKNKDKIDETKKNKHIDKSTIFVKGMALFLAIIMVVGMCTTLIFALIFA